MSYLTSPWFLLPILAAGLWLAHGLYFRSVESPSLSRRWILAVLTVLAWIALAGLIVQPLWNHVAVLYHPPAIVIAVDESPSFAGGRELRAEETVRKTMEEARTFYQGRGFRVLNYEFGERARPAGSSEDVGVLTSQVFLRNYLDSLAIPNLQGIFLWTDGRWNLDSGAKVNVWPAPVFPVTVQGASGEVQGESVKAVFSDPDSGAEITVDWRFLGGVGHGAKLELRSGANTFYREGLPNSDAASGGKLRHQFRIAAQALRGVGEKWIALIRPEKPMDNFTEKNDTVEVDVLGLHRKRQVFVRPLSSLEERGLMDALFSSDSMEVVSAAPESLETSLRGGGVLWARMQFKPQAILSARKTGAPVILYALPDESADKPSAFTPAAHVSWREDVERFLPAGVLSLADLGVGASGWEALKPDSSLDAIAWVEERGRRGLMFGRGKNALLPVFECAVPPVWSSQFHPGADERVHRLQERWLQGVAEWARVESAPVKSSASIPPLTRLPLDAELSRLGEDDENLSALALAARGTVLRKAEDPDSFVSSLPELPQGQMEEKRSKSRPLFPSAAITLTVIGLLSAVWALRKRLNLD